MQTLTFYAPLAPSTVFISLVVSNSLLILQLYGSRPSPHLLQAPYPSFRSHVYRPHIRIRRTGSFDPIWGIRGPRLRTEDVVCLSLG
ncbi:hypothetical protein BD311DRAFT_755226 [Dichomitus squalens]|uniref:Uncharacterized protein n=1 Tax=Dichomitus squalens TaxID=114155 RepID=A0A4Q9MQK0_9APHY|nr:hypothetical protein BD311DRAFT_755226 [Dichomitus squalens]